MVEKESKKKTDVVNKSNKKLKKCHVFVPNGQEYLCEIPKNALGEVLIKQFFEILNLIETDYFGLYFHDFASYNWWLEPNKPVKKQIKNEEWKLYFGVKFYPPKPCLLQEDCTRYYLVLQLRDDIFGGRLPCTFANHALLGSYVVQSELGDYDPSLSDSKHYSEFKFAPNQTKELELRIKALHELHKGQTPEQAELRYLQNVRRLPMYGIDLHHSRDVDNVDLNIGIGGCGINIYKNGLINQKYVWNKVIKLSYTCSKFSITYRSSDDENKVEKVSFKMANHRSAKKVWRSGVEHHSFFRISRNDRKPKKKLIRIGSKFRYSGRTQNEAREVLRELSSQQRKPPTIRRTQSRKNRPRDEASVNLLPIEQRHQVVEEVIEVEQPPPLPEKKSKRSTAENLENIPTNTKRSDEEYFDCSVDTGLINESLKESSSSSSSSSTIADVTNDPLNDLIDEGDVRLSQHQRQVQKMKIEFLAALPPRSMCRESQSSLEALDARLPPRLLSTPKKIPQSDDETTSKRRSDVIESCSDDESDEMLIPNLSLDDNPPLDGDMLKIIVEETPKVEMIPNQIPDSDKESLDCSSSSDSIPKKVFEDPSEVFHEIPTVETKSSKIQEVLLPQGDNEIRLVALKPSDDVYMETGNEVDEDEEDEMTSNDPQNFNNSNFVPPTVSTETIIISPSKTSEKDEAFSSYSPPVIPTEMTTITYQSHKPNGSTNKSVTSQLVTSQVITSETDHDVTTTEITKVSPIKISSSASFI